MSTYTGTTIVQGVHSRVSATLGTVAVSGPVGRIATNKTLPLANVGYTIDFTIDPTATAITIDLSDGSVTGASVGSFATGTITFTGLPTDGQTVTVNSNVYTFRTLAVLDDEIQIGVDADETGGYTAIKITAQDSEVSLVNAAGVVTITTTATGIAGNSMTLAESATNVAVSGATLSGGADGVTITGMDFDDTSDALPVMALVHAFNLTSLNGSFDIVLGSVLKDSVDTGIQLWSVAGRADLIGVLTITSTTAYASGRLIIRAST